MIHIKMRRFVLLTLMFFVAGGLFGMVLSDAPAVEEKVKLQRELQTTQQQVKEYRVRCIDWSHYVFQLEHSRSNIGG